MEDVCRLYWTETGQYLFAKRTKSRSKPQIYLELKLAAAVHKQERRESLEAPKTAQGKC